VPVAIAMPIAHRTDASYDAFAGAIARGRPFRQPLETDTQAAAHSPGLELYLSSLGPVRRVYAPFAGSLSYEPGSDASLARLILSIGADVLRRGRDPRVDGVEAPPARIELVNVDQDGVRDALESLLADAHLSAMAAPRRPASWHPAMRILVATGLQTIRLGHWLSQVAKPESEIVRIVGELVSQSGGTFPSGAIPVLAGEWIGAAAAYPAAEPPAPLGGGFDPGTPADAQRARRVTVVVRDGCEQATNPLHHLQRYVQRALAERALPARRRRVTSLTTITDANGQPKHPLFEICPELVATEPPPPRGQVGTVTPFPLEGLAEYHGFPVAAPVGLFEWRYSDASQLEARRHAPPHAAVPLAPQPAHATRAAALWTSHGQAITTICGALQIPPEVIVALACTEALPSLSERSVRLEPLRARDRARLLGNAAAAPLETAYDKAVGIRGAVDNLADLGNGRTTFDITLDEQRSWDANFLRGIRARVLYGTQRVEVRGNDGDGTSSATYTIEVDSPAPPPEGTDPPDEAWVLEGYSPPHPGVPDPWAGGIRVKPASTLTWAQLLTVVEATRGERISPGLIQTLVSTAREQVDWLRAVRPGIFEEVGAANPPAGYAGYLNDWLLEGTHSLLVGAAYVRRGYNRFLTGFDLPLVGGVYNSGSLTPAAGATWGVFFRHGYADRAALFFNAAASLLGGTVNPPPTVRFMR
jgi:hypothetical protein